MPNDLRIKTAFIGAVLRETAEIIQSKQRKAVEEWNLFESGRLRKSLTGHFSVGSQDGGGNLTMRYLPYMRMLDMEDPRRKWKKDGYHLYNKIVFGVLYNPTINTLQWGLTEDIREAIGEDLKAIYDQDLPFYKISNMALERISEYDRNLGAMLSKAMRTGYR
jgi:hypothetical protein